MIIVTYCNFCFKQQSISLLKFLEQFPNKVIFEEEKHD